MNKNEIENINNDTMMNKHGIPIEKRKWKDWEEYFDWNDITKEWIADLPDTIYHTDPKDEKAAWTIQSLFWSEKSELNEEIVKASVLKPGPYSEYWYGAKDKEHDGSKKGFVVEPFFIDKTADWFADYPVDRDFVIKSIKEAIINVDKKHWSMSKHGLNAWMKDWVFFKILQETRRIILDDRDYREYVSWKKPLDKIDLLFGSKRYKFSNEHDVYNNSTGFIDWMDRPYLMKSLGYVIKKANKGFFGLLLMLSAMVFAFTDYDLTGLVINSGLPIWTPLAVIAGFELTLLFVATRTNIGFKWVKSRTSILAEDAYKSVTPGSRWDIKGGWWRK